MLTLSTLGTLAGAVAAVTAVVAIGRRLWAGIGSALSVAVIAQCVVIADGLATQPASFPNVMLWVINGLVVGAAVLGVRKGATSWIQKAP